MRAVNETIIWIAVSTTMKSTRLKAHGYRSDGDMINIEIADRHGTEGTNGNILATMSGFEKFKMRYCQTAVHIRMVCTASEILRPHRQIR